LFWIGLLGGIASILAFIGGWFTSDDWKMKYIAVSSTVYIVVLLCICAYIIWDRGKLAESFAARIAKLDAEKNAAVKKANYRRAFRPLHSVFHKLRDTLVELRKSPPRPGDGYDDGSCRAVLDVLHDIFQTITGASCSTCIKAFDKDKDTLTTIGRDSISEAHRGGEDTTRTCRVSGNKDFQEIVTGRRTYFICNDLVKAAAAGDYFNDNPNWRNRYRSTIVWPIRYFDKQRGKHELFGFLCADSMATEIFDEEADVQVGACVADMIYAYFSAIDAANVERS